MNAPPFPANPAFGQYFGNWVWSGSRWVCTNTNGIRIVTQVFRASAPYTPSPGLVSLVCETIGAGGPGGAVLSTPSATTILGGGGGGSGGYSRIALASGLVLGGVNVIVGASTAPGVPGGATSFGAFCVANGGHPGLDNAANSTNFGGSGPGAAVGVGDIAFPGASGQCGIAQVMTALLDANAQGGAAGWIYGGNVTVDVGPVSYHAGGAGLPGTGAGGSGGCANQIAPPIGTVFGGLGGSGLCIVTEYCWADAIDDSDCGCGTTMSGARVAISAAGPQGRGWGFEDGND